MDDTKWRQLCQQIMAETDPEKLWVLVEELNKTLETRERQLRQEDGLSEKQEGPGDPT